MSLVFTIFINVYIKNSDNKASRIMFEYTTYHLKYTQKSHKIHTKSHKVTQNSHKSCHYCLFNIIYAIVVCIMHFECMNVKKIVIHIKS